MSLAATSHNNPPVEHLWLESSSVFFFIYIQVAVFAAFSFVLFPPLDSLGLPYVCSVSQLFSLALTPRSSCLSQLRLMFLPSVWFTSFTRFFRLSIVSCTSYSSVVFPCFILTFSCLITPFSGSIFIFQFLRFPFSLYTTLLLWSSFFFLLAPPHHHLLHLPLLSLFCRFRDTVVFPSSLPKGVSAPSSPPAPGPSDPHRDIGPNGVD